MRKVLMFCVLIVGCASPVLYETTVPPGEVVDALADPEAFEACRRRTVEEDRAILRRASPACYCATICPKGDDAVSGRCMPRGAATATLTLGACVFEIGPDERTACEVPDWPLYRCEPGRL